MPGRMTLRLDPEREEAELRSYLGGGYDRSRLEQCEELLEREVAEVGDEGRLYRTSQAYLYNLTAFAMTGTKLPYLELLLDNVRPGARILDYGCGIGSDGLMLLEAGFQVEFADFDNPSVEYLRWRLEHRGLEAAIHDLDREVPGGFDAAYSFDVIEHVPDAWEFLAKLEERAALVEVNLLEFEPHRQELHYELPIGDLVAHAQQRDLRAYEVFYETSHVLLYGPQPASAPRRLLNRARVARTRVGSR